MKVKWVLVAALLFFAVGKISAQCCAAGNPVGGDGSQDGLRQSELRIFAAYRHSLSRDFFAGTNKLDINNIEKSYYNYGSLSLTYGLNWRFTFHTEFGYFLDKAQVVNLSSGQQTIAASGLGDVSLGVRYSLLKPRFDSPRQFVLNVGTRLPIGAFEEEKDGVKIPVTIQPSSGAFKLNGGLFYSVKKPESPIGYSLFGFFEWSNKIEKQLIYYDYGNVYMAEASVFYPFLTRFVGHISARAEFRDKDKRAGDVAIESSGGKVIYVKPQLQAKIAGDFFLVANADLPLYKNVNGEQLTNRFAFQVGIRKAILL